MEKIDMLLRTYVSIMIFTLGFISHTAHGSTKSSQAFINDDTTGIDGWFYEPRISYLVVTSESTDGYYEDLRSRIDKYDLDNQIHHGPDYIELARKFAQLFKYSGFEKLSETPQIQHELMNDIFTRSIKKDIIQSVCDPVTVYSIYNKKNRRDSLEKGRDSDEPMSLSVARAILSETYLGVIHCERVIQEATKTETRRETSSGRYVSSSYSNKYRTSLTGRVYWYRVDFSGLADEEWERYNNGFRPKSMDKITFVYVDSRDVTGSDNTSESGSSNDYSSSTAQKTDSAATDGFFRAIRSIEEGVEALKMQARVVKIEPDLAINVGSAEGVYLDQGFRIFRKVKDADGNIEAQPVGFVRVREVGDNKISNNSSTVYPVIDGGIKRGHFAVSQPSGIDWRISAIIQNVELGTNALPSLYRDDFLDLNVHQLYRLSGGAYLNLAGVTGVSQLYGGANILLALPSNIGTENNAETFVFGYNLAILKKYWFGNIGAYWEGTAGFTHLYITDFGSSHLGYEAPWNIDLGANGGLEIPLHPNFYLVLTAGYNYVLNAGIVIDKGYSTETRDDRFTRQDLSFSLGGFRYGLSVSFTVPR